jgi:hypothetical protein
MRYTEEFITKQRERLDVKKEEVSKLTQTEIKIFTKYIIEFEDYGQDFLKWYIDEDGFVLDSIPFQKSIWAGHFTIPQSAEVGGKLAIWLDEESYVNYPIKSIEIVRKEKSK